MGLKGYPKSKQRDMEKSALTGPAINVDPGSKATVQSARGAGSTIQKMKYGAIPNK